MANDKNQPVWPFICFGDGLYAQVLRIPKISLEADGTVMGEFFMRVGENVEKKFNLKPEDYDDFVNRILIRSYPIATQDTLGGGYVDKMFVELYDFILRLDSSLGKLTGDKEFQRLKFLLDYVIKKKRYAVGVREVTKDPQAEIHYFCTTDINGNPTHYSEALNERRDEQIRLQQEIFRLKGQVAYLQDQVKISNTGSLEHLKSIKEQMDAIGTQFQYPMAPEDDMSGKDESYG